MNEAAQFLIDGYLDDMLTIEQHEELSAWIRSSPENASAFAAAVMLHDRLRNELVISGERQGVSPPCRSAGDDATGLSEVAVTRRADALPLAGVVARRRSVIALVSTASLICVAIVVFLKSFGDNPAVAAAGEIQRLIELNALTMDRTYKITVEEAVLPRRGPSSEDGRPPKAPMDGATLYVRDGQQFVLSRVTDAGPFVTGSNGKVSWAVRPDGPVRYSKDLNRFNRDLPGHEHEMPLVNIHDGLERLRRAYDVQLLPVEDGESSEPATRLLVAVRHPKERGPRRVEISYEVESGLIGQMRFIEMPYGPESLTLRLTLLSEDLLDERFFDHESHHDANRRIEVE
ncbi:MAG: hypothetical protein NT138_15675 [Planctomycetales bacterium]|jgi:hypothetical protein|nr:hypothetical protein [Planctomycetales bacterium]